MDKAKKVRETKCVVGVWWCDGSLNRSIGVFRLALVGPKPLVLGASRPDRPVALLRVAVAVGAGGSVAIRAAAAAAAVGVGGRARVALIRGGLCGRVGGRVGARAVALPGGTGGAGGARVGGRVGVSFVGRSRAIGGVRRRRRDERGSRGLGGCAWEGSLVSVAVEHARVDSAARIERERGVAARVIEEGRTAISWIEHHPPIIKPRGEHRVGSPLGLGKLGTLLPGDCFLTFDLNTLSNKLLFGIDLAATDLVFVQQQRIDHIFRLEYHEAKAPGTAGYTVYHYRSLHDRAIFSKIILKIIFGGFQRNSPNKDLACPPILGLWGIGSPVYLVTRNGDLDIKLFSIDDMFVCFH